MQHFQQDLAHGQGGNRRGGYTQGMPNAEQDWSEPTASTASAASAASTAGLLERARTGDEGAFDHLFARAVPRLDWFVRLRLGKALGSKLEPEDVLQETYAVAWTLLEGFESRAEGAFVRWLFVLAENQIRRLAKHHDALRRNGPQVGGPADAALALAADPASGPCTRALRVEKRRLVADALAVLAEEQREALILRVIEGRPLREVAERMGRSETALRRLVARATEALGRELEGERDDV